MEVEIDPLSVLKAIQATNNSYPTHVYNLIKYCNLLLMILGSLATRHIYREANGVVD